MAVYTLGIWTAKEGREDDFVRAWEDMATKTKDDFPNATAKLLRDRDSARVFISFGPWESLEQIGRWRESETFKNGIGRIRDTLDEFTPHTLDVVASID